MSLIDRYLAAVAAQLKPEQREDVIAELRDDLMSRIEAREATLGRDLTDEEVEAVLQELGHPLAVAARYGSGPQHLIGPELFPWWLFAMKVGLAALALLSAIGIAGRMFGGIDFGQAFAQAFRGFFDGGLTLLGIATVAGFIWERYGGKPDFISKWRVKDLGLFELGRLSTDSWSRAMQTGAEASGLKAAAETPKGLSPMARAMASAAAVTVLLLWWTGVIQLSDISWSEMQVLISGDDYTAAVQATFSALWWPVIVYAVCRIAFDLFRAARPRNVRATAVGDIGLAGARVVGGLWLLFISPLAQALGTTTVSVVTDRLRNLFQGGWAEFDNMIVLIMVGFILEAVWRVGASVVRLFSGRDRRLDPAGR